MCLPTLGWQLQKYDDEKKYYEDFYADVFLLIEIKKDEEQFTLIQ